ncbi:four-carbon acid sugar kinase family protein [Ornithinibacillus halophilus]|uniref:Uncharacterized conserved protein YgbK, DUF1537 family n=1 Tax=Ornithinibacillus halophilus TaxID=930117 RepID=A0A1M5HJ39_9BACI|nr:four-carbon acid sugar kinase family protein [Ornithinibacillus halophilus]SHG15989.1 Uncharacterized conserved protein YgbK, DUF1537 family [Ornithinibacillus halophilus]
MKVGVIADDLTGANGTGVKLTKLGLKTKTTFYQKEFTTFEPDSAICLDTDSRYLTPLDAQHRVLQSVHSLTGWQADLICKRIDSTFRGNIGPELEVLLNNIEGSTVVIVPTFPSSGRTVVGGYLLVNGKPLHETDVANDPISPIVDSYLPAILEKQTEEDVAVIELNKVSSGSASVTEELENCINRGTKLVICDAITEQHIETIARAMTDITSSMMIPADPGPLTTAFTSQLMKKSSSEQKSKVLVSVGSVTSISKSQIDYLASKMHIKPVYARPDSLASFGKSWEEEIERVVLETKELIDNQETIIVTTNHSSFPVLDFKQLSKIEGVSEDLLAKRITAGLAEISKRILQNGNGCIKGCFFSGGDVTASFCEAVEADGFELVSEVMPLVAHGVVSGGEFQGLSIVTKGGMIGDKTAIYESVTYLKETLHDKGRILHGA